MAEEIAYKVSVDTGEGGKSLKSLKQDFKEAQKELDGLEHGTTAYVKALEKLGGIRDNIKDLNDEINAFNPAGKVKAFQGVVTGLASGFEAAAGASALFGDKSEQVEKILLRVQAAMAFSEGIKGIAELGDSFTVLSGVIKAAFATNPLTLILLAATALSAALVGVYYSLDKTSESTRELTKAAEEQKDVTDVLSKVTKRQVDLLTAQGASEEVIIATKKKLIAQQLNEIKVNIELHQSKLRDIQDNNTITETIYLTQAALYEKLGLTKQAEAFEKMANANKLERAKEDLEAIKKEKEDYADLVNTINVLDAEQTTKHNAEMQKRGANQREATVGNYETLKPIESQIAQDQVQSEITNIELVDVAKEDAQRKELEREAKHQEALKTLKENSYQETKQLLLATQAISDLVFAHSLSMAKGNANKEREIRKKQFKVNKAFGVANSIIDGVQAVQKALNNPYPLNIILAVASGILATANTVKIASTKMEDGGGAGGGGGIGSLGSLGGGVTPPTIAPPSSGLTELNPDGTIKKGGKSQPTVRAIVVETDITKSQKHITSLETRAKL